MNQASFGHYFEPLPRPLWPESQTLQDPSAADWEQSLLNIRPDDVPASIEVSPLKIAPPSSTPKTCQYPGCTDKRVFLQDSALKRHMNKHKRPYRCTSPNCKVRDFSNSGDLKRHQRTVHSNQKLFCPVVTCKRHTQGFGRKDNWMEHLKRVHTMNSYSAPNPENTTEQAAIDEDSVMGSEHEVSSAEEMETSSSVPIEKASLEGKLQELEMMKERAIAKFDGDIAALKRVLSLM
ncbi:Sex-determining transformer protein [Lachnellula suecica]|uniref:Sex-determining transformer protein n=1 Tax=Lachnellula suecica TaxID=602035 RepID=A0A8T9C3I5_9HELO|nr:Sex-determining transformer protein [Lachnellula suecica]